jgi:hypothetical protein
MKTNEEAKNKIAAAEKLIAMVDEHADNAFAALRCPSRVNGYGIYHDQFEVRAKLETAQYHIQEALNALEKVDWPTDADYDSL